MDIDIYLIFVTASILLCVAPGPDMVFLLARSIAQGRRAGVCAAFGINAGAYVHLLFALLGLTAILATSSIAFSIVKWLGAIYLIYIGLGLLAKRSSAELIALNGLTNKSNREIFWQGFISDVLNPKVALFYLAFLPQFVVVDSDKYVVQLLLLGVTLNLIGLLCNLLMVSLSTVITNGLRRSSRMSSFLEKILGAVFVGLGIRLTMEKA